MRALTWIVLLVVALSGVLVFAGLVGKDTDVSYRLLPATCAISIIGAPLFLLLAARQSRKDREDRERRERVHQKLPPDILAAYAQLIEDVKARESSPPPRR